MSYATVPILKSKNKTQELGTVTVTHAYNHINVETYTERPLGLADQLI